MGTNRFLLPLGAVRVFILRLTESVAASYFSFTKSNTKIAQTPTVRGNCTKEASRSAFPLGRAYVASNMARAVSTPRSNLLFQFMLVRPPFTLDFENGSDCTPVSLGLGFVCAIVVVPYRASQPDTVIQPTATQFRLDGISRAEESHTTQWSGFRL
jgi:hypothetical protein